MILLVASTYTIKSLELDVDTHSTITINKPEDWVAYLETNRETIASSINKQNPHSLVTSQEVHLTLMHTQEFHDV